MERSTSFSDTPPPKKKKTNKKTSNNNNKKDGADDLRFLWLFVLVFVFVRYELFGTMPLFSKIIIIMRQIKYDKISSICDFPCTVMPLLLAHYNMRIVLIRQKELSVGIEQSTILVYARIKSQKLIVY
jgi:hypothetical protein